MMPADSNLLIYALAISSFSGSRWRDFAKTGGWLLVLASHPRFSKWREIFEAKF
jgi:hypothetical protein